MRRIAVLDAPSNLGLRPPTVSSVPGCAKAPGALRDHGLVPRLSARDAGCVTPPRYDPGDWRPGDGVAHAEEIAWYSRRLADRIGALLDAGEFPVVLGGDCSILLGSALAANRLSSDLGARVGLVYVDGHADFRHPGNASYVGAAAGEDLALVTGRGQADLAAIENRRPYFHDSDVVVLGIRTHDEHRHDLHAAGIAVRAVPQLRAEGAARSAQWARGRLSDCLGYWVHLDVDVLDPAVMPAVDAPDPGGIAYTELELLIAGLVATPHCLGVEITVFDPDYDPTGTYAAELVEALVAGLAPAAGVASLNWDALTPAVPAQLSPSVETPVQPLVPAASPLVLAASAAGFAADAEVEVGAEVEVDAEFDVDSDAEFDVDSDADAEVDAEAEAEASVEPETRSTPDGPARVAPSPVTTGPDGADGRGPLARPIPQRSPLERLNVSDMVDTDRMALSRRRSGGIPLRRREEPAEEPTAAGARADRGAEPRAAAGASEVTEHVIPEVDTPLAVDQLRAFAGLAEQVRAAGSGQVPAARAPADPSAVPATPTTPPAETA
jgi:arginase